MRSQHIGEFTTWPSVCQLTNKHQGEQFSIDNKNVSYVIVNWQLSIFVNWQRCWTYVNWQTNNDVSTYQLTIKMCRMLLLIDKWKYLSIDNMSIDAMFERMSIDKRSSMWALLDWQLKGVVRYCQLTNEHICQLTTCRLTPRLNVCQLTNKVRCELFSIDN